jgi:hypothetical protein
MERGHQLLGGGGYQNFKYKVPVWGRLRPGSYWHDTNQIRSCLCLFALEEYFLILEHTTNYMSIGATASCHKKMTHMPRFNGC